MRQVENLISVSLSVISSCKLHGRGGGDRKGRGKVRRGRNGLSWELVKEGKGKERRWEMKGREGIGREISRWERNGRDGKGMEG